MKLSRYEQETIVSYNAGEQTATIYTRDKAVMRKLDTLVVDFPDTYKLESFALFFLLANICLSSYTLLTFHVALLQPLAVKTLFSSNDNKPAPGLLLSNDNLSDAAKMMFVLFDVLLLQECGCHHNCSCSLGDSIIFPTCKYPHITCKSLSQ